MLYSLQLIQIILLIKSIKFNKKGLKRTYNEMLENSMSIETDSIQKFPGNKLLKKSNNEINLISPKNNDPIHYYYTDPLNFQ